MSSAPGEESWKKKMFPRCPEAESLRGMPVLCRSLMSGLKRWSFCLGFPAGTPLPAGSNWISLRSKDTCNRKTGRRSLWSFVACREQSWWLRRARRLAFLMAGVGESWEPQEWKLPKAQPAATPKSRSWPCHAPQLREAAINELCGFVLIRMEASSCYCLLLPYGFVSVQVTNSRLAGAPAEQRQSARLTLRMGPGSSGLCPRAGGTGNCSRDTCGLSFLWSQNIFQCLTWSLCPIPGRSAEHHPRSCWELPPALADALPSRLSHLWSAVAPRAVWHLPGCCRCSDVCSCVAGAPRGTAASGRTSRTGLQAASASAWASPCSPAASPSPSTASR